MEGSSPSPCLHLPVRSISLPSREHPISLKFDAVLNHLKSWQILSASETAPFGAESFQIGLVGLAELYNYVEQIFLTPQAQQAIIHYQNGKLVEEALDGSLTLLDTCGTAKDLLLMMKEHVLALQSAFRRKGGNSSNKSNIYAYINSRKKVQKDIGKCLVALKKLETKVGCPDVFDADQNVSMVVRVIREASIITISIFRSLLLFLSMPGMKTRSGWASVSKLISLRSSSSDKGEDHINEIKSLDLSLSSLHEQLQAGDPKAEVKRIQTLLEAVNLSLDSLEAELECMSRCLVQNRVSLLNILTQ
ncbi:conserved hypothetical protein [Ricinus communis]|uniref:Uncharacterized protein n=2 Tax=Ricinus communis TaxID=3988 RepID=B9S6R0_RICCO|nr:conserved hypothetical protein [Ricinus communis]|eukprot:XP_002521679.1 uncharacterized protein LOC8268734 [Ricinus communis]